MQERIAAQMALADLPLQNFLDNAVVPYEADEVTRFIYETHDPKCLRVRIQFYGERAQRLAALR